MSKVRKILNIAISSLGIIGLIINIIDPKDELFIIKLMVILTWAKVGLMD